MTKVTQNDLLAALAAAAPELPGPEWLTVQEIMVAKQWSEETARRRIRLLEERGDLEKMKGPRRTDQCGVVNYYRLKGKS